MKPNEYNRRGRTGRDRRSFANDNAAPSQDAPRNVDAERFVLASLMADNRLFEEYSETLKASDFTEPLLRQAYTIGARLVVEGKPANAATIEGHITELSPVPDLSVPQYLRKLNAFIRGRDEVKAYADEVRLATKRRAVLDLAERFQAMAKTGGHDLIDQLSSAVALLAGDEKNSGMVHLGPHISEAFQTIMANDAAGWGPTGLRSGFDEIDYAIGGFKPAKFYVIAANEKAGKSALGLSLARQFLLQDIPVAIFSLEMKHAEISERMIMLESGISVVNRRTGQKLTDDEAERLSLAADRVESWELYGNDLASITPAAIAMNARHAVKVQKAKVIIVDYLQIVNSDDEGSDDTRRRVEKASRACARLAKELNVPVIALAQLNREAIKRGAAATFRAFDANSCRPRRGDIRETAQIEMDADAIIAIYRPEIFFKQMRPIETGALDDEDMNDFDAELRKLKGKAELNIILNRSGPDGVRCDCRFHADIMLFAPNNYVR